MQRIVVLNPKGGSDKTTLATNLAARFAAAGRHPVLMDLDPQGSSTRWLANRGDELPAIHGIAAYKHSPMVTRSWQLRIPRDCGAVIVDTPAALARHELPDVTRGADAILVPVMPSDIDIHAAANCVTNLLLVAKVRRSEGRLGIVANRVRGNTLISQALMRFLESLDIPLVATLRDTQHYVRAAQSGHGIDDRPPGEVGRDLEDWNRISEWLESRRDAGASRPARHERALQPSPV